MTEYHFTLPGISSGRSYLLEINPHYTLRGIEDNLNVIDARWIDTDTGLFIDISTVRRNYTAINGGIEGALMCKDRHHYLVGQLLIASFSPPFLTLPPSQERDIFPLRDSFFEGFHVKIPFDYSWLLEEEYGRQALTLTTYEKYVFQSYGEIMLILPL